MPSTSIPSARNITSPRCTRAPRLTARRNSLDHDGFYQRMDGYSRAAENVAYGCSNADCAYRMWANSSGHRRNMLMGGLTHYGLASATSANGRRYWVLELAGERPAPARLRTPAHRKPAKTRGGAARQRD